MKDDLIVVLIDCINLNPNLDATKKIELIALTLKHCQQVKIGKIITDAIEKKTAKRGRGRPKGKKNQPKELSEHAKKAIAEARKRDMEHGL